MNYAFRVFAFNPRKVNRKDAPKSWDDLLQPKWKGEILFDESSLEEVMALLAAWGKEKTVNYFTKLSQQQLLIRVGRDTTTQMMMAGEAPLAVTTYAYNNESLRAQNAPVDWVAEDLIPALIYPLTIGAQRASSLLRRAVLRFSDFRRRPAADRQGRPRRRASESRADLSAHERVAEVCSARRASSSTRWNKITKFYKEGIQILDEIVLKRKSSLS